MKSGIELITDERKRQFTGEGWTLEHDDQHISGEMAIQAAALAANHTKAIVMIGRHVADPWGLLCKCKPGSTVRDLVKAGALIAAEIDRLQRISK